MAKPPKNGPVGRRQFLKGAAAGTAGLIAPETAVSQAHQRQDDQVVPADVALRVKALESLLVEKGLVDPAAVDAIVDVYENKVGPRNGARVVARAWVDPAYKKRLLTDATSAIAELGYGGAQGDYMAVVENGPRVHNVIVCTLCSCYPWPTLGLPPTWYKSAPYRSRVVIDPRGVLREFGSSCQKTPRSACGIARPSSRYLVLPEDRQARNATEATGGTRHA
jgi:nitrile hydratase